MAAASGKELGTDVHNEPLIREVRAITSLASKAQSNRPSGLRDWTLKATEAQDGHR